MTVIRIPRRSIDNVYAGFTHRKMIAAQARAARSKDARRIGRRFVDSDLYPPDVLSGFIRSAMSADWTDSECMAWLLEQWTLCDALRSVAAGKVPRYAANLADLLDPDLSAQGFTVDGLFDYRALDHVAEVLLDASIDDADYAEFTEAAMPLESAYVAAF